jgi:inner membrane protein import complex subunit Tim44-like protein
MRLCARRPGLFRAVPLAALAFLALLLLLPAGAVARPGGGQSYSGGGHSGGGGGGGGGGDGGCVFFLIEIWFRFVFAHPLIGIPLTILIVIAIVRAQAKNRGGEHWDSAPSAARTTARAADLEPIRALDPDFSTVLFEDFAYDLYARAHEARSDPAALAALAPYLSEGARRHLAERAPIGAPVSAVVVGALRVAGVTLPPAAVPKAQVVVVLEYEANLTVGTQGAEHTQYLRERWQLARGAAVRSKPPDQVGSFHCPNCGAPFQSAGGGRCDYCGEVVTDGRFDWSVQSISVLALEDRPPALTGTVPEVGTDFPTIVHPQLAVRRAQLLEDDPAATDEALTARLHLIYDQLNAAWTNLDLKPARPYVSDSLFEYLEYWIDAYKRQGLRNVLEGMRITRSTLAKVVRDKWFDALTFRVWGAGRDSTVRQDTGQVVGGNPRADRAYSEYWTLIRGAGVRGAPKVDRTCPNCGAPLETNMAGDCEHCGAKVTRGDFDWVLSKIEQDDSYTG